MDYDFTRQASELGRLPPEPPKPPERSVWSHVVGTFHAAGAGMLTASAQVAATGIELAKAATEMRDRPINEIPGSPMPESEFANQVRSRWAAHVPDPATASTAERLVYGLTRGLTKIVGGGLVAGTPGVIAAGFEEANTVADELKRKEDVDQETRMRAGIVQGAGLAAAALPILGATKLATAGLYVAGGPGGFIAQQSLTADILRRADYGHLAAQYDWKDPLGLAISTLVPLPFVGVGLARQARAAKAAKAAESITPRSDSARSESPAPPELVDAAMVHNLTTLADMQAARATEPTMATGSVQPADVPTLRQIDADTGLPLNEDGTVTLYHHTDAEAAAKIRKTGRLKAAAEPDVYVTTRAETDTGYGDTAVAIRVDPRNLVLDDEFPSGRLDFRLPVGRPGGTLRVTIEPPPTTGAESSVVTERGLAVPVRWRLAEAGDLITSHTDDLVVDPRFPEQMQPRDRTRAASAEQIARIENAIRPELLGESVKASDGAPIIGSDAVVESGNARTIALRRAYASGKAQAYRAWVESNAARFGLDPEQARAMREPVLVRERSGDVDRAEFARQANESPIASMSPVEQARADAARMKDLGGLVANDDGTVNMAKSGDWVRAFMRDIPPTERGAMMQADGQLSQTGLQRIRNAVFAKAYGDPEMLAALTESTDSNIKNILAGMLRAAPDVAKLRDLIEAGARQPIDLAPDLAKAVRVFSDLRRDGMTVDQYMRQGSMFGDSLTPEQKNLLVGLGENSRAPKRVAEMISRMVEAVDTLGDPRQAGMFDDTPKAVDVAADAVDTMRMIPDDMLRDIEPETVSTKTDPLQQSVANRVQAIEATNPDLPVEDGVTARQLLERVRQESDEGAPGELGRMDADLVRVAAECALSVGAA